MYATSTISAWFLPFNYRLHTEEPLFNGHHGISQLTLLLSFRGKYWSELYWHGSVGTIEPVLYKEVQLPCLFVMILLSKLPSFVIFTSNCYKRWRYICTAPKVTRNTCIDNKSACANSGSRLTLFSGFKVLVSCLGMSDLNLPKLFNHEVNHGNINC